MDHGVDDGVLSVSQEPPRVSGGLPLVGHAWEFLRDPTALLMRGLREHGEAFSLRLGPRTAVVMLGPERSRFVFTETDRRLSFKRAYPFVQRMFDPGFYFFADDEEYHRQRSVLLPRFQGNQLDGYVGVMAEEVDALIEQLGDEGRFEVTTTLGPLVMRIAAATLIGREYGRRLGPAEFRLYRRFTAAINGVVPSWLPTPAKLRGTRARTRLREQLGRLVRARRQEPLDPPDFLQSLVAARYPDGSPLAERTIVNVLIFLIWSGHETTTGHLSWGLIHLLLHERELAAVTSELDAVLSGGRPESLEQVGRLKQLDAALHESERLNPVVFVMLRHAEADIDFGGHRIAQDSLVMVSPWASHRMAEVFPDPEEYRPDRFATDPRGRTRLIGFGGGIHRCLGQHFAYLEMKVILARLLTHYELELVTPHPVPVRGARTLWPSAPCTVAYRRRR